MAKIRVLIVDDAVVVRSRVSKVLASDDSLEVVGIAANGRIALAKIPLVNPDVIILDVEMPEMNGLETLVAIRKTYPHLPVIMFSTFTRIGAAATLEALSLGANDYATKPISMGSEEAVNQHIREDLVPKIKLFGSGLGRSKQTRFIASGVREIPPFPPPLSPSSPHQLRKQEIDVVAIGVSTGGPNALSVVLPQLPKDFPVPILIVQHMPPMFTKLLAEQLSAKSQIQVYEAVPETVLKPGCAWIAPGGFHMVVEQDGTVVRIATHQAPPENSCRPSVDVLFRSVAKVYGAKTLAVVLTGMGQDGLRGCECIRQVGGQILAQDEASSVVWGMPGFVANAGLADQIVSLENIPDIIQQTSNIKNNI
ncbi:MAG: chemotaxis response regulator protein-glutamate methylesterase [Stigonema ocellatum SAG 48.90 = DSM 106950]|nr:chemotaxis response regulator protein-glutamate methylesterase [Stigonema ocellatum SAG 48.90 = DSM 106950]